MRFGLPEHPEHIQSLVSKAQGQPGRSSIADKPSHGRCPANHKRAVVYAVVESNPKLPRQQPQNEHHSPYHDDDGSKGAAAANMFMMTQDSDGPLGKTVWAMSWRVYLQAFRNPSVGYVVVTHGPSTLKTIVSAICVMLVLVDVTSNNWELNDVIGNTRTLFTPVLNVASQQDLTDTFTFAEGYSLSTTSNVGLFMLNYTLQKIHAHYASMYVLTANTFLINGGTNDIYGLEISPFNPSMSQTDKRRNWSTAEDVRMLIQVIADEPFAAEKSQMTKAWQTLAEKLMECPQFTRHVDARKLQHRFTFLVDEHRRFDVASAKLSGSDQEETEKHMLLDDLLAHLEDTQIKAAEAKSTAPQEKDQVEQDGNFVREMAMQTMKRRAKNLAAAMEVESERERTSRDKELEFERFKFESEMKQREIDRDERRAEREHQLTLARIESEKMSCLLKAVLDGRK
ncbi:hypothetical protein DYB34_012047 [Aphanomyces astaci]|uniref:Myb-like domain-containing protein n=3 Tax=Aphanomyces astaci TaxID=112090 RepID=A0A418BFT1_APHAT|nr:hypothetical protein DYB34_012047 [Aphanomyces astaci]